jgi:hypothetical protein
MGPDQAVRDLVRVGVESRVAAVGAGAAAMEQDRAATVFVRAAAKRLPTSWEWPVLI